MNIDELTIGQLKQLQSMLNCGSQTSSDDGLCTMIDKVVLVRTYSAGVWCGTLARKSRNEVILTDARRMWQWKAEKSISLSGVAKHGIDRSGSRIAPKIESVWLEAIEIIPLTSASADSILGAEDAKAS